jgi:hypothetical protein
VLEKDLVAREELKEEEKKAELEEEKKLLKE